MQDQQARNKNLYRGESSGSDKGPSRKSATMYKQESYEAVEKRRAAAVILDSPELLMMHAQSRGDSIPGTRQHFTKILCGYDELVKAGET